MTEQPKDQPKSDGEATPMSDAALDKVAGGYSASDYCTTHYAPAPCRGDGTCKYIKIST